MEYQRQELLRERQQFHMEQLRAAEYRAKQMAAQQLASGAPGATGDSKAGIQGQLPPGPQGLAAVAQQAQAPPPSEPIKQENPTVPAATSAVGQSARFS